jgi:sterol desaturase/sphingolipid hydroxylase (fatty acid hydroxylase superfamily)
MIFSIDKDFLATFALPLAVGLTSAVLPSWYLEHAAKQPWAKQYLITYREGEDRWKKDSDGKRKKTHHHDHHDEIERQSLLRMFLASFFAAVVLYSTQLEILSYASLMESISYTSWFLQFAALLYTIDFIQYVCHYAGHETEFLWKYVHSKHHQIHTPSALQCAYGSILSPTLGAALPVVLAYLLCQPHASVFYVVAANQVVSFGPYGHSGMQVPLIDVMLGYGWLPFRATPRLHDAHHRLSGKAATNLGTTIWLWDYLFGTLTTDRV